MECRGIKDLNNNLLLKIFSYLTEPKDILSIRLVCKNWAKICNRPHIKKHLTVYIVKGYLNGRDPFCQTFHLSNWHFTKIEFHGCHFPDNDILINFFNKMGRILTHLKVTFDKKITYPPKRSNWMIILKHAFNLHRLEIGEIHYPEAEGNSKHIHLAKCKDADQYITNIDSYGIRFDFTLLSELILNLKNEILEDWYFQLFNKNGAHYLTYLEVISCQSRLYQSNDQLIALIRKNAMTLKTLILKKFNPRLLISVNTITELNLTTYKWLNVWNHDELYTNFLYSQRTLETLKLSIYRAENALPISSLINLKRLTLEMALESPEVFDLSLANSLTQLTKLKIKISSLNGLLIKDLGTLPSVTIFDLEVTSLADIPDVQSLDKDTLKILSSALPNLIKLKLINCCHSLALPSIFNLGWSHLKQFYFEPLDDHEFLSSKKPYELFEDVSKLSKLEELSLTRCYETLTDAVIILKFVFNDLKKIHLANGTKIRDKGVIALMRNCNNVESLTLEDFPNITDTLIVNLVKKFKKLKHIHILGNHNLTDYPASFIAGRKRKINFLKE